MFMCDLEIWFHNPVNDFVLINTAIAEALKLCISILFPSVMKHIMSAMVQPQVLHIHPGVILK